MSALKSSDGDFARITADRLVHHLTASGFVLMKGGLGNRANHLGDAFSGAGLNCYAPNAKRAHLGKRRACLDSGNTPCAGFAVGDTTAS